MAEWPAAPIRPSGPSQIGFATPLVPAHACSFCTWQHADGLVAHGRWRDHRYRKHHLESPPRCLDQCPGTQPTQEPAAP